MDEQYYIWSYKHNAWWRKGSWGYTNDLQEAEVYCSAKADYICSSENSLFEPPVVEKVGVRDEGRLSGLIAKKLKEA